MYNYVSELICNGTINIIRNNGSISTSHSTVQIDGVMTVINNNASVYFFDSEVAIGGTLIFADHIHHKPKERDYTLEGGCLTLFISRVYIYGSVTVKNSTATNGGGILSLTSRIAVLEGGKLTVTNNKALDTGGGVYLYHSELYVRGSVRVSNSTATSFGGGLHCISSAIVVVINRKNSQFEIRLENNSARSGGGICLEASSKIYIKSLNVVSAPKSNEAVYYTGNQAVHGGAIYVADNTTSGICSSTKLQSVTSASQSECFIQILNPVSHIGNYPHIRHYFTFSDNVAFSGAKLYGGLLDRCTVNAFGRNIQYSSIPGSLLDIYNGTTSDPVRVCLCELNHNEHNCDNISNVKRATKGRNITLRVAAVDQVSRKVKARIHASLLSQRGYLGDHQQVQNIKDTCTDLHFTIFSPLEDDDILSLYAEGPCNDLGISPLKIGIEFIPCQCPLGFQPQSEIKERCVCGCHRVLENMKFIKQSDCDSETLLLARNKEYWIGTLDNMSFLTYEHCPADYCLPSTVPVHINFSVADGPDVQCSFHRRGVLCGRCKQNFSLSLGSSRCVQCPHFWPAILVLLVLFSFLAGLGVVFLILVFNLTVAKGTLNAIIFYANVFGANRHTFMHSEHVNFPTVIISWFNLDVGFDVCFFEGMDAYAKAWLQLCFPLYLICIVVAIIVMSRYSKRFANLIAHKNPVATLATLILLSYAKLLHSIIGIMSFGGIRRTPLSRHLVSSELVWLSYGSVKYLRGVHILLFLVALVILFPGFIYTFLLISWQWIVGFSNIKAFFWVRSVKLANFMDAYHAPYTSRNRYWTGLLLLARVILYLVSAVNRSGEPSINLLAVLLTMGCIMLLHTCSGIGVYKKSILNSIEFFTYFNILSFAAFKFYVQTVNGNHGAIVYISIGAQIVAFTVAILHHFLTECRIVSRMKYTKWYKRYFKKELQENLLEGQELSVAPHQKVTYSEIVLHAESKRDVL